VKIGENVGCSGSNELDLTFQVPNYGAKFHHNRLKIAAYRHTDGGDFIICPMLCYSNGTDKNMKIHFVMSIGCVVYF